MLRRLVGRVAANAASAFSATGSASISCRHTAVLDNRTRNAIPVGGRLSSSSASDSAREVEDAVDPQQLQLLEEPLLLVDEQDNCVGSASKRQCHSWSLGSCPLHRAFSVFLFDSQDRLLLQQRSEAKITFPGHYTNTCCSHPLAVPEESEADQALGVIRAARRRLFIELGIPPEQIPISQFHYLTRILYKAPSCTGQNSAVQWGEHEVDYILVVRGVDPALAPNLNEVNTVQYVPRAKLPGLISKLQMDGIPLTPWFRSIVESGQLEKWWQNLDRLEEFTDHVNIHRM